ncbi:MAG: hypothetical protein QG669_422 [Patescibacteria group bacterium]|nr:hypothetical protein [Patescibacteria group bacterium]
MRESQESDELALLPKINALLHSQLSVHDLWDFSHTYKNKKPPNWEVFYFLRNCHHNSYPSSDFVSSSPLGEAHHPVASRHPSSTRRGKTQIRDFDFLPRNFSASSPRSSALLDSFYILTCICVHNNLIAFT